MSPLQKMKQHIWNALYPVFPYLERAALPFHSKQRQKHHLGWIAPNRSLSELKRHLHGKWGYGNHFVAWEDKDQVLSWRKLTSFNEQYHLRVYSDGEIRGHYELSPEASPIRHFFATGQNSHRRDFFNFLEGFIVSEKYPRHLKPETDDKTFSSETVFEE